MAEADKNTRRADEAERARHIGASEAAAFATTAGAMMLGLLTGVEAAQHHRSEHPSQPQPAEPALPPAQPADVAPAQPAAADHGPILEDEHGTTAQPAPADSAPTIHADTAPDPGIAEEAAPDDDGTAPMHPAVSSIPVWESNTTADHAHAAADGTGTGGAIAPASVDPGLTDSGAFIHQLTDTITGLVDAPLAIISDTIASLNATVAHLTSSLSGTISQLSDSLTGTVTGLIHDAPVAGALQPLLTDILNPAPKPADLSGAAEHGTSMLDTAGAVPIAPLHPFPLHLGFLGQATIDGHDTHDGAFSALGVHHF
jgi:hypothetical protein